MEERKDLNFDVFNLTKDTVTVKEVAEICKKHNPKITLRETNDEIPNLGFSLSNKKILKTGFKFLYELNESIKEMIFKWSKQNLIKDLEHVRDGENEFIDERGKISNHELTEPINLIGLIGSKRQLGNITIHSKSRNVYLQRPNNEIFQDILNPHSPKITQVVNAGQLSIIKPNVAHAWFLQRIQLYLI